MAGNKTDKKNGHEQATIEKLLEKSKGSDLPTLLQVKEKAKQIARQDPTSSNITALRHADALLKDAEKNMTSEEQADLIFKNVGELLRYLQEDCSRQIQKSKLYEDIRSGLMPRRKRKFRQRDADRYAASLPLSSTPDGRTEEVEKRQRRKDEAEIRIKEAQAEREEKRNAIMNGEYIEREEVYQELAARAIALNTGLKSTIRAKGVDIVKAVGGDLQKTEMFLREIDSLIDIACSDYSRVLEFEIETTDSEYDESQKE